jgi:hypothetical protein
MSTTLPRPAAAAGRGLPPWDRTAPRPAGGPGFLRRTGEAAVDLLALLGVVFAIPFVILAVGLPVALSVRLLLWAVGALCRHGSWPAPRADLALGHGRTARQV